MRKDLHHLPDLAFAADRRRDLVLTRKLVHRNAKMTEDRRQLVLLPYPFLLFFALAYAGPRNLRDLIGRHSQILQNIVQNASFVVRKYVENIGSVDHTSALRTRAVHRTFKKLSCLRRNAKSFSRMLAARFHTLFDQQPHRTRIYRKVTHRRREKILFFEGYGVKYVFDRNIILVAFARLGQRTLKHAAAAVA